MNALKKFAKIFTNTVKEDYGNEVAEFFNDEFYEALEAMRPERFAILTQEMIDEDPEGTTEMFCSTEDIGKPVWYDTGAWMTHEKVWDYLYREIMPTYEDYGNPESMSEATMLRAIMLELEEMEEKLNAQLKAKS